MIECSWKSTFGIECLTCGFQRSVSLLFEGKIVDSFLMFPATIPLFLTFIITALHLWLKFKNGASYIVATYAFTALLIVGNYVIKLSHTHL